MKIYGEGFSPPYGLGSPEVEEVLGEAQPASPGGEYWVEAPGLSADDTIIAQSTI